MKVYTAIISAVFGGVDEIKSFINKDEAEAFVLDWANANSDMEFSTATEAVEWFKNNSESVDYIIQLFESEVDIEYQFG